ncbi:argininosuccinate lyase [Flammeovirga yaeyamensis]|uniref:Argininosuccinate lyase n=1 Tax=Flammeovirga yaeyamensis TaxID=367791 RepID=A0AAX1NBT5_9BACT|nr:MULTISPECIES: argininosuccinate lyase [Flammeovirga]ANQ49411.1 argininosuccinate lyase [Flammeovirga sp. MY04]MBB3697702.1 argininosuccinate lyase [Flammeovirga yaeyamensis]NMF35938.1 argininosuccinate lyase [Flammeovirga yaeyamensis]QWG03113.1 argininosuccinate lyase [Flammeovirga yaeyamensis]
MKLWQKSTYTVNEKVDKFTVGKDRELDILLAPYDVKGSMAHATMLAEVGLLTEEDKDTLLKGLQEIYEEIERGEFVIEDGVEDVHSQVEMLLTQRYGDVGKRLHSGRSRNDQVLLDLKLYLRDAIKNVADHTKSLFDTLVEKSEEFKDYLMPGYTHMQVAMPSSFGLWLGAYAESLVDDMVMLKAAYDITDRNPLGSAAGYGSSFPLNRTRTTELMDFQTMAVNVVYAQMGRGKTEYHVANAMASVAATVAKLSMDGCMYAGGNFGFLKFPNEFTTGSSIMPHKKNPDVLELTRARCNQITSLPTQIMSVLSNLPVGYHRDLQQIKEMLLPAFEMLNDCLEMTKLMFEKMEPTKDLLEAPIYDYLFSVEEVNKLVLQGIPFREAYVIVGEGIEKGEYNPERSVNHNHEGSIGNLGNDIIKKRMEEVYNF